MRTLFGFVSFIMSGMIGVFFFISHAKGTVPVVYCDVKGTYSGTNLNSTTGASSTLTYMLLDNHLAVGSITPTGSTVTRGSYRNTCDSVILSVYYNGNKSYYILKGKLTNNHTTISGTFRNLTTPTDFGTFSISK